VYEKYILWNNDDEFVEGAINANKNYGPFVRYLTGLLSDTEYVIFQDNDLLLNKKTINDLLEFNKKNPDSLVGLLGKKLSDDPIHLYTKSNYLYGEIQEVDIIISKVLMMKRKLIPSILEFGMHFEPIGRCDDIVVSMANKKNGRKNFIIPGNMTELDEEKIGLRYEENHFRERDEILVRILKHSNLH
jgi:hypothetical protein